ncbi:acetyltransferase [Sporofaciens musculi]|uniref:acetyltransferase n=1 Tax=Sporofaciens musculi TaxID=2681861 RepID=UPI00256FCDE3|nr:acetyltransferase [Sporofaciens musculi]
MDEKKRLVLLGGGGHCSSVLDAAQRMGMFDEIVITDCDMVAGTEFMGSRVVGTDDALLQLFQDGIRMAFISMGSIKSTKLRKLLYRRAMDMGFDFPNIIDPSALVSEYAMLGKGIFVGKNSVINAGARVGDMAIINTGAIVEHGSSIGSFSHISVGAVVCGDSKIGNSVFVGANAAIIQGVKVGANSIVGAGSIVLKDAVPDSRIIGLRSSC